MASDKELRRSPPDYGTLQRFGIKYVGPQEPICVPMDDGYWTPWHLAQKEIELLKKQRDFLVEEYERAVGCGSQGYVHAAMHLFNAITNARIDAKLKEKGDG